MEFNVEPYYDDFEQNAANNNYLRVLFKPGYAVQARELTQIQSILQNQIKQFGNHIFQNGSPVIGGNLTFDNKVKYLKLLPTYNNNDVNIEEYIGKVIRNSSGNIQAKVLSTYYPTGGIPTLLVKYITGNEFADGDIITIATTTTQAQLVASGSSGLASVVSINEGVFYVDGFFVKVLDQTTPLDPYSVYPSVKVGLQISDDIVDSIVDSTLLDPAQNSFNYQAPGADRYQFNLTLSTRPLDTVVDESKFFELMRVENGVITKQIKYPVYAELEKSLARRTYDESGDYTVNPFRATVLDGVDPNTYTLAIDPGKAYVKGFEFETLGTIKISAPKPRSSVDVKSYVDIDIDTSYGNYVYVTALRGSSNGFINIAALETIDIHTVDSSKVAVGLGTTANVQIYANTKIGTARIKNFSREAPDLFNANTDSNGVFKLYLSDLNIQPKVTKVSAGSSNANTIVLSDKFSTVDNAYANVILTVLPIRLDSVANVNTANIFAYSYRLNANSAVANVFSGTNVAIGDIIRVGDMVRQITSINTSGDYLTVNAAWSQTIVGTDKDTNPLGVYKQTSYTQNVSSQFRNIQRYDGATHTIFLDAPFDNNGIADGNTVVQLNYGLDDADSFIAGPAAAANNLIAPIANASMNVSFVSRLADGSTYAVDPLSNKLIFQLPGNYTKRGSLNNVDYYYNKFLPERANSGTAGQFILSQGAGLETFETIAFADSTSAIQQNLIVIVRDNGGNTTFPNGSVIQLTSSNISISGVGDQITINTQCPEIKKADIIVTVKENDAQNKIRKKVLMSTDNKPLVNRPTIAPYTYPSSNGFANVEVVLPNFGHVASIDVSNGYIWLSNTTYNSVRSGDVISLFAPDVIKVRKVIAGNTTNYPDANNYVDITSNFAFISGQKDDMYDHASLQLLSGRDSVNAKLLVHVDMYQHIYAAGSNVSYFSVDSYANTIYDNGQIPVYTSSTGNTYNLRDCLDFRPTRQIGDVANELQTPNIPGADTTTELSFQYYLPRIDKLVLSKDKEFRIVQGKSAANPIPPNDVDDAMTLFQINLPPYVANINDVRLKYFDNRRFTMKDIASISKKVDQLSYFVSLNNVENLALSDPTQYEDGTDKAKYGIVGENFTNFNIADYKSKDFGVTLENGMMTPGIRYYVAGLKEINSATTSKNMKTVSLEYTETPAIVQSVASDKAVSVQPFLFGAFNGTVELYPDTDYWVSRILKPEVISPPETIITEKIVVQTQTNGGTNSGSGAANTAVVYPPEQPAVIQRGPAGSLRGKLINNYGLGDLSVTVAASGVTSVSYNVYYVNPVTGALTFISSGSIGADENGNITQTNNIIPSGATGMYKVEFTKNLATGFTDGGNDVISYLYTNVIENNPVVPTGTVHVSNTAVQTTANTDTKENIITYTNTVTSNTVDDVDHTAGSVVDTTTTVADVFNKVETGRDNLWVNHFTRNGPPSTETETQTSPPFIIRGCPDPSMLILLADDTWVAAGDLQVGMVVKTQHENTFAWGDFNVIGKSIMTQPKLEVVFDSKKVIVSESHRFWVDNRTAWINTKDLEVGDVINGLIVKEINDVGEGPVVRITIDEAHTYIMEGLLSHNMKIDPIELLDNP